MTRSKTSGSYEPAGAEATREVQVASVAGERVRERSDSVALEEPLEIRVVVEEAGARRRHSIAVTMRTPGDDRCLAAGFLVSEGVIRRAEEIWRIEECDDASQASDGSVVDVYLAPGVRFDPQLLTRNVLTTSSCGICGRTSIESVRRICRDLPYRSESRIEGRVLRQLPERLRRVQRVFAHTGSIHAAALFDPTGELLRLYEDVGRHNALDKLVGSLCLNGELPAATCVLLVSGRTSFELVQKTLLAGVPVLAAIGAPSSLAVELAADFDLTLVGFLDSERFNIYSGSQRVILGTGNVE